MTGLNIEGLVRKTKLHSDTDVSTFHRLRVEAMDKARDIFEDRACSYNRDHNPTDEMVYGSLSLASEIHKRSLRMTGLLSPMRGPEPLRDEDMARLLDTCLDLINYASWQYAMLRIAFGDGVEAMPDTDPRDVIHTPKRPDEPSVGLRLGLKSGQPWWPETDAEEEG